MRFRRFGISVAAWAALSHPVLAQSVPAADLAAARDFSGFWELSFDSRKVPEASLTAEARALLPDRIKHDAHAIRYCTMLGTPFIMDSGRPLDIEIGREEIIMAAETFTQARHIYLRPKHVDAAIFDPTSNGDSIAHWEGDTLIADTVGFDNDKGLVMLPGGGFRTGKSHLVERYRLMKDGTMLSVTFTWDDPAVFRMSHTYEFRYYRMPAQYVPMPMVPCNLYDEERAKFLEGPGAIAR